MFHSRVCIIATTLGKSKKEMQKHYLLPIILFLSMLAVGCSSIRFPGVYRIDIPQGNFITKDMLAELRPGMTPDQVLYVLGEPILTDPFTQDTWFYPMVYKPGKGETTEQSIVVHFEQGAYSHYDGEVADSMGKTLATEQDKELERRLEEQRREQDTPGEAPISVGGEGQGAGGPQQQPQPGQP